ESEGSGGAAGAGEAAGETVAATAEAAAIAEATLMFLELLADGLGRKGAPVGVAQRIVDASEHLDAVPADGAHRTIGNVDGQGAGNEPAGRRRQLIGAEDFDEALLMHAVAPLKGDARVTTRASRLRAIRPADAGGSGGGLGRVADFANRGEDGLRREDGVEPPLLEDLRPGRLDRVERTVRELPLGEGAEGDAQLDVEVAEHEVARRFGRDAAAHRLVGSFAQGQGQGGADGLRQRRLED